MSNVSKQPPLTPLAKKLSRRLLLGLAGSGFALPRLSAQTPSELNFTTAIGELRDLPQGPQTALLRQANEYLAQRPRLTTLATVKERGAAVRRQLLANIGGPPAPTPLRARTVGVVEREKFRIEKVIFESQPDFFVTGNLYVPKHGNAPYPAILFPLGHEAGAKAHESWQHCLGSFATKGFVAFAWDPPGQGERVQFFDPSLRDSLLGPSTLEHTILGVQCLLNGDNMARYMVHDGLRALDYLLSRPEVDPKRVGVTGNSGGGTATAYLTTVDDRVQVAAPSCYITSWTRLLAQLGPQDAEQNLPPWINLGFDFPDFLYAAAPKPYLVLSAVRDFFPIGGARATFAEAQQVYQSIGAGEKIKMVEADDGHGYTLPRRLAAYSWMSQWLKGAPDDGVESEFPLATEQELQCTPTGQVSTSLGGESVFSLNQARFKALRPSSPPAREAVLTAARQLSGYQAPTDEPAITRYGVLRRNGYRIEKLVYTSEPGVLIPAILAVPEAGAGKRPGLIYVNGEGKAAAAPLLEKWMAEGRVVLAIDARGFGELQRRREGRPTAYEQWLGDTTTTGTALLLGKTLVGLRARDIVSALQVLAAQPEVDPGRIEAIGAGHASIPALFAAAFEPRLQKVGLEGLLSSYASVVNTRLHRRAYEHVIPGVLRHFDIPDLIAAVGPRVQVLSRVDAMGDPVPASQK